MSVDIVGSTAYKQAAKYDLARNDKTKPIMQPWIGHFTAFFVDFSEALKAAWEENWRDVSEDLKLAEGTHNPLFWKGAGDEAIFTLDLETPEQAVVAIHSFRTAMHHYRIEKLQDGATKKLDVKGTAWLAGFPVNNAEVVLGYDLEKHGATFSIKDQMDTNIAQQILKMHGTITDGYRDFLGPQIDLGFRLTKYASPRRLIVSVDLAYMLAKTYQKSWPGTYAPFLHFDETETLKGVLSGTPYPVIWCDAQPNNPLNKAEDDVRGRELRKRGFFEVYCKAFIAEAGKHHPWMISPFIKAGDGTFLFGDKEPEPHQNDYMLFQKRWNDLAPQVLAPEASEEGEVQTTPTKVEQFKSNAIPPDA